MISGVHLPNQPLTADDLALFAAGQFGGAFLMPEHGPIDMQALRDVTAADLHFVSRLPDSTQPDGHVPSAKDYAAMCARQINALHPYGCRDFQLDNEPMFQAFWRPDKAWAWQAFMHDVLRLLRPQISRYIRLGLAPLVLPPEPVDDWAGKVASLRVWEQAAGFLLAGVDVDWVAAHCYWQAAADLNNLELGLRWAALRGWSHLPVVVTEYANSRHEIPGVSAAEVEAFRVIQYPQWLAGARTAGYVEGAYVFILNSTPEWAGFRLTGPVVAAIGGVGSA